MLDHLLGKTPDIEDYEEGDPELVALQTVRPEELTQAQVETATWLESLGAPDDDDITTAQQQEAAREAFALLTTHQPENNQRAALLRIKSPAAVQKLHLMLNQYDWEFVDKAKEMRNYVVGKIMEETGHHDARVRLRALELLGKVTEVSLFTDRVEIKHTTVDEAELKSRLKQKLEAYLRSTGDLEDAEPKQQTELQQGDSIELDAQA